MAERGTIGRVIVPVICIAVTAAALNNVYGDTTEVEALAEQIACGSENCSVKVLQMSRTPFGHTYVYQTNLRDQSSAEVKCAREMILVGNYECELK